MNDIEHNSTDEALEALKTKLNRDTAKINWSALQEHHQKEAVIRGENSQDLVTVAGEFVQDNHSQVKEWLDQGAIAKVGIERGQQWLEDDIELWAVVVAPWILVQEISQDAKPDNN